MNLFITFWAFILTSLSIIPDPGNINLTVRNIQQESGEILIGLYKNPDNFPDNKASFKAVKVKAKTPEVTYTFNDIPDGDYAIAIFHDKNSDGELNFKLFFIPKEPYGFSNDFVPRFSKPTFEDARFSVMGDTKVEINLID